MYPQQKNIRLKVVLSFVLPILFLVLLPSQSHADPHVLSYNFV